MTNVITKYKTSNNQERAAVWLEWAVLPPGRVQQTENYVDCFIIIIRALEVAKIINLKITADNSVKEDKKQMIYSTSLLS